MRFGRGKNEVNVKECMIGEEEMKNDNVEKYEWWRLIGKKGEE